MSWPRWLYKLDDVRDGWFADDKVAHWLGGAFAMCKLSEWAWETNVPMVLVWALVLLIICGVEAIELYRYERWIDKGAPSPWPWLTDLVSLKDIAWGIGGAWMATW